MPEIKHYFLHNEALKLDALLYTQHLILLIIGIEMETFYSVYDGKMVESLFVAKFHKYPQLFCYPALQ